jgi:hypothetical protein
MTNLIETLNTTGAIELRGCVLKIKGDRYHMSRGDSAHSIDIDSSCERRLAAHWSGFVDTCGTPEAVVEVAKPAAKKRQVREYVLTFACVDRSLAYVPGFMDGTEKVFAENRADALKQGREINRTNCGPYGPKTKISARLAYPYERTQQ